ncbi:MAG TPA: ATP-dependent DNA helicase RecG [Thermoanaerobaculia bacterium]|nr:ATP-dependent DNA helicase RecG [Thermoanaerobaculia bacterium]
MGPCIAATLAAAGLTTVGDLIWHLPRLYEDRRQTVPVKGALAGSTVQLRGTLEGVRLRRAGRRVLVEATFRDASGALAVTWFGQPWLADKLPAVGEVVLHGRVQRSRRGLVLAHPEWRPAGEAPAGVEPVYPDVAGIGGHRLRGWVAAALARLDLDRLLPEPLPPALLARHSLPELPAALRQLHSPPAGADPQALSAGATPAHHRLVYGELLAQQRELAARALAQRQVTKPHRYRIDDALRARAREVLPFRLTGAQKRVLGELVADLQGPAPMRRLLQGDVGSGKTIVAALLLLIAAESGLQAAFLAPTELLAEQHFLGLSRLLGRHYRLALFAGGRGGEVERRALARGQVPLVVGTQALLEPAVRFQHLALVVIDEQHRFGVRQRELLAAKGARPDLLVMSATPIPRSLALAAHGDLDLAVLDELPAGRSPVATEVVPAARRREVYGRLREELAAGGQAYVVFPAIGEAADGPRAPSLAGLGERLRQDFASVPSAVLHGELPAAAREQVMEDFRRGDLRLLLATTVVEVGVDVPAATAMVIEGAERFGLAQLHQLRGRVGRSERASWCVAIHGAGGETARQRLAVFAGTTDGFAIAEEDLRLRGPGELLGERQAGLPPFRFAQLPRDHDWLVRAWRDARELAAAERQPLVRGESGRGEPGRSESGPGESGPGETGRGETGRGEPLETTAAAVTARREKGRVTS